MTNFQLLRYSFSDVEVLIRAAMEYNTPDDLSDWDDLADELFGPGAMSAADVRTAFKHKGDLNYRSENHG